MGEGDVEQAVAVHVHDGDAACEGIVKRLGFKVQIAQIPEDLALAVDAGEDQIEIAVIVQIVGGHAGAVAEIGADLARRIPVAKSRSWATNAPEQRSMSERASSVTVASTIWKG